MLYYDISINIHTSITGEKKAKRTKGPFKRIFSDHLCEHDCDILDKLLHIIHRGNLYENSGYSCSI